MRVQGKYRRDDEGGVRVGPPSTGRVKVGRVPVFKPRESKTIFFWMSLPKAFDILLGKYNSEGLLFARREIKFGLKIVKNIHLQFFAAKYAFVTGYRNKEPTKLTPSPLKDGLDEIGMSGLVKG